MALQPLYLFRWPCFCGTCAGSRLDHVLEDRGAVGLHLFEDDRTNRVMRLVEGDGARRADEAAGREERLADLVNQLCLTACISSP